MLRQLFTHAISHYCDYPEFDNLCSDNCLLTPSVIIVIIQIF